MIDLLTAEIQAFRMSAIEFDGIDSEPEMFTLALLQKDRISNHGLLILLSICISGHLDCALGSRQPSLASCLNRPRL
jgi:hypothetical protein